MKTEGMYIVGGEVVFQTVNCRIMVDINLEGPLYHLNRLIYGIRAIGWFIQRRRSSTGEFTPQSAY